MTETTTTEAKKDLTEQVGQVTLYEMAALPEHHQEILGRAMAGDSYVTIAEQTGLKLGTVRSRLNRARARVLAERAKMAGTSEKVAATMGNST